MQHVVYSLLDNMIRHTHQSCGAQQIGWRQRVERPWLAGWELG
jgi:hypothetical protein